jgi:hypothetical protein
MAFQNLGMFPLADPYGQNIQVANPYGGSPSPLARANVGAGGTQVDPQRDPCPTTCPPGWRHNPPYPTCGPCEEINPNVEPIDPTQTQADDPGGLQIQQEECVPPAGGCPQGSTWSESTCSCFTPTEAPGRDVIRSTSALNTGAGGHRSFGGGSAEYGSFGRSGGGLGGGAMSDLALYDNPMLAMGSDYLGKNVSAFNKGGRMRSPYYDNGGKWQEIARAMNGILGMGQAANVMQGSRSARPMPRRRFVKGGRF